jgi:CSLREA domain-containing protein
MTRIATFAAFFVTVLACGAARAATIQVSSASDTVANDGLCTLREAVTSLNTRTRSGTASGECVAANGSSDRIQLMTSAQVYTVSTNLVINRSVAIHGYGETTSVIRATAGRGFEIADTNTAEAGPNVAMSFLTIENGRSDTNTVYGVYFDGWTGAPMLDMDNVTIRNCTRGVFATGGGTLNQVTAFNLRIEGSRLDGVYCRGCTANFERAVITNNAGSGIWNRSMSIDGWPASNVVLVDSILENNGSTSVNGGGIRTEGGGHGNVSLTRTTVSGNRGANGGGIYNQGALLILQHSTISTNTAAQGAGIYIDTAPSGSPIGAGGENNFYNATIAANTASVRAGGLYAGGREPYLLDTILGDNVDNGAAPRSPDCKGSVSVGGSAMIEDTTGCVEVGTGGVPPWRVSGQDLKLGPLVDSGAPNTKQKVHVPLKGSVVINADGTPDGSPDGRGMPRPEYLVNAGGTTFRGTLGDAGAVEYNTVWDKVNLQVAAVSDGFSSWDADGYFRLAANATGDQVTFVVPVSEQGTYDVTGHTGRARDGGNYRLEYSHSLSGPWTTLVDQDQYTLSTTPVRTAIAGTVTIPTAGAFVPGLRYFRFRALGKNVNATGYLMRLTYLKVEKR